MLKKLLTAVALALLATYNLKAATDTLLVVRLTTGEEVGYLLTDRPQLTFEDGMLVLTSERASAEYALTDVEEFYFTDDPPTGLSDATSEATSEAVRFETLPDGTVRIHGVNDAKTVRVFDLSGRTVAARLSAEGGSVLVDLHAAPSGIYLITLTSHQATLKIRKP